MGDADDGGGIAGGAGGGRGVAAEVFREGAGAGAMYPSNVAPLEGWCAA